MAGLQPGTMIAGKYRLLKPMSEGGMGAVWRAQHEQLEAPVAIKLVLPDLLKKVGTVERFEREAKASARIRSPYVVHINDHGIDEATGMPFIVMELLDGEDLQHRLRRVGRLPPDQAVAICEKVSKGLARAHELGIVHRDLKPANIFLCEPDDEMVKILDFGIAKEVGQRKIVRGETTTTGQVLGTPHYMSPEQARGKPLTVASDLWSLAVIMFRTLVGQRPFDALEYGDLVVKICSEPVPKASELNPALGPAVDAFFERAFDRSPGGRFESPQDFMAAFERAVQDASEPRSSAPSPEPAIRRERPSQPTTSGLGDLPVRRVIRGPAIGSTPEERSSKRVVILGMGVIVAGAIVLVVARRPGDFRLGAIVPAFEEAARKIDEMVNGKPPPAGVLPADATPEQKAAAAERAREDAWSRLYQQLKTGEIPLAVASFEEIMADYGWDETRRKTIVELTAKALGRPDEIDARMRSLLTDEMGSHGPDVLYDVMVAHGDTVAGKVAAQMLADDAILGEGSPDLRLAYRLRTAPACSRRGLLLAAKADAGATTLREVRAEMKACSATSRCCLAGDAAVKAITEEIAARDQHHAGGSSAQP